MEKIDKKEGSMRARRNFSAFFFVLFFISLFGCSHVRFMVIEDPLTAEEHINLGVAYEHRGELDHALKEYQKASRDLPLAYYYMGNIYFQIGDYHKAEKSYKKAIRKNPQHADAYNNLAWLYYTIEKNLEKAEELAKKAIAINPSRKRIYADTLEKIKMKKSKGKH